uniref:Dynein heavy chain 2, axonemal n=1 Tax=Cacopsylla melanoneura TaxID=428564 RepID=A0A8D8RBM8_9HEMI
MVQIMKGIEEFEEQWSIFNDLWKLDKDEFFNLYRAQEPTPDQFHDDINKFNITLNLLEQKQTQYNVRYLILDAKPLLLNLQQHAKLWQLRFIYLLTKMTAELIECIYEYTHKNTTELNKKPTTVNELNEYAVLHSTLVSEIPELEEEFIKIDNQLAVLNQYNADIPEIMLERKRGLPRKWKTYLQTLDYALTKLLKLKELFKVDLKKLQEEMAALLQNLCETTSYPTSSDIAPDEALKIVAQLRQNLIPLEAKYRKYANELEMLKAPTEKTPWLSLIKSELNSLKLIWEMVKEWNIALETWGKSHYSRLDNICVIKSVNAMHLLLKKVETVKTKNWQIYQYLEEQIQNLCTTLKIIHVMKTVHFEPRHTEKLQNMLGIELETEDEELTLSEIEELKTYNFLDDEEFTLSKMQELEIYNFFDEITELVTIAGVESQLVDYIQDTKNFWSRYKVNAQSLRTEQSLIEYLENDIVQLTKMKDKDCAIFCRKCMLQWIHRLSTAMKGVNLFLHVQQQFQLIESLDDHNISPEVEEKKSDVVKLMEKLTQKINKEGLVLIVFNDEEVKENLDKLSSKLNTLIESVSKCLTQERQLFPRFYFVSDEFVLQTYKLKDYPDMPKHVNNNVNRLFPGVERLEMNPDNKQASGMLSTEGELIHFSKPVEFDRLSEFLQNTEKAMHSNVQSQLTYVLEEFDSDPTKKDAWIKKHIGMLCYVANQIYWTAEMTKALEESRSRQSRKPLKTLKKKQNAVLQNLTCALCEPLSSLLHRVKIEAIVMYEIHTRDNIEKIYRKMEPISPLSFEWHSQLRYYLDSTCKVVVKQTNTSFPYGYEYLGTPKRVVVTPLTDRCFLAITTALHLSRGSQIIGPTSAGKSETIRELARCLAYLYISEMCSEKTDYKTMQRIFTGLAKQGSWFVFDEFDRVRFDVMSVAAQNLTTLFQALSERSTSVCLEGQTVRIRRTAGVFICTTTDTNRRQRPDLLNVSRTELPDNLKTMFRPVCMMVPDAQYITEVKLFLMGFNPDNCQALAVAITTLYTMLHDQLSVQVVYDFRLRALVSLLDYAGIKKEEYPLFRDEEVLLLSVQHMIYPKIVTEDIPIFLSITNDIFPRVKVPPLSNKLIQNTIKDVILEMNLEVTDKLIEKVIQLKDMKQLNHCIILVGPPMTGKTAVWSILQQVVCKEHFVQVYIVNPKETSHNIFGEFKGNQWHDGILTYFLRKIIGTEERGEQWNTEERGEQWIVLDGPADITWTESLNSVMEKSRLLTLPNSETITLPEQGQLLIETENLDRITPSSICRCGILCHDVGDCAWQSYMYIWYKTCPSELYRSTMQALIREHVARLLEYKRPSFDVTIPLTDMSQVASLCRLLECFTFKEKSLDKLSNDPIAYAQYAKQWFLFCLIWSVCGSVSQQDRLRVDSFIRERDPIFPSKDLVFDYYIDTETCKFVNWSAGEAWHYDSSVPFYKRLVPTVDMHCYTHIISSLVQSSCHVLMMGESVGKTGTAWQVLNNINYELFSNIALNLNEHITTNMIQESVLSRFKKQLGNRYTPQGNKTAVAFIDDMSMASKDKFGDSPVLELIQKWMHCGYWYHYKYRFELKLDEMVVLGAIRPASADKNYISNRFSNQFTVINMTLGTEMIQTIFSTMLQAHLTGFDEHIVASILQATNATINLYENVLANLIPNPDKMYYVFTTKDISKVFEGLLRSDPSAIPNKDTFTRLWVHECNRVFSDRIVDVNDKEWFDKTLSDTLNKYFDATADNVLKGRLPLFSDIIGEEGRYEEVIDSEQFMQFLKLKVKEYNEQDDIVPMDLVLFQGAMEHIIRIGRVISQPKGHLLLVGMGGSGRTYLTRISAFLYKQEFFSNQGCDVDELLTKWRHLYCEAGIHHQGTCFLFKYTTPEHEVFFGFLSAILRSGDVPGLITQKQKEQISEDLRRLLIGMKLYIPDMDVFEYFLDKVRLHFHLVFCISSTGPLFKYILKKYPYFLDFVTIDWIDNWPKESLQEVAERILEDVDMLNPEPNHSQVSVKCSMAKVFTKIHTSIVQWGQRPNSKRSIYVTLKNYVLLLRDFTKMFDEQRDIQRAVLEDVQYTLFKIDAFGFMETMRLEMEQLSEELETITKQCDGLALRVMEIKRDMEDVEKEMGVKRKKVEEESLEMQKMDAEIENEVKEATPELEQAVQALQALEIEELPKLIKTPRPNPKLMPVINTVMILLGFEPSFTQAKKTMGEPDFLESLYSFDRDHIDEEVLARAQRESVDTVSQADMATISKAAEALYMWVIAIEKYAQLYRMVVASKESKLAIITANLMEKEEDLDVTRNELSELKVDMKSVQAELTECSNMKDALNQKISALKELDSKGGQLTEYLSRKKDYWLKDLSYMKNKFKALAGDCALAISFLNYIGPFDSEDRRQLLHQWKEACVAADISVSLDFSLADFLSTPSTLKEWTCYGLPQQECAVQNAVIITQSHLCPLVIDPRGQALKWMRNMREVIPLTHKKEVKIYDAHFKPPLENLQETHIGSDNWGDVLTTALKEGHPVLLKNVTIEDIQGRLSPYITHRFVEVDSEIHLHLGDKTVLYNDKFRLFMMTKIEEHFPPEIFTNINIVNFTNDEKKGLENEFLDILMKKERPEETQILSTLRNSVFLNKKNLHQTDKDIISLLNQDLSSESTVLDNKELFSALEASEEYQEGIADDMEKMDLILKEYDRIKQVYHSVALRVVLLYFILIDLRRIDLAYVYSLGAYIKLFECSVDNSEQSDVLRTRVDHIIDHFTYAVYKSTCPGLYEHHKLLFSFLMCVRILSENKDQKDLVFSTKEYEFLLRGVVRVNNLNQTSTSKPDWITESQWDDLTLVAEMPGFRGLIGTITQMPIEWFRWYQLPDPENKFMPPWNIKCNMLQKMLILRCLRPDRLQVIMSRYVGSMLGPQFTELLALDVPSILSISSKATPLLFLPSPEYDHMVSMKRIARELNMEKELATICLGPGQTGTAEKLIENAMKTGGWVYIANCHATLSWLISYVGNIVDDLQEEIINDCHPKFRLWLSSNQLKDIPVSLLQHSIKIVTQPVRGIRANMEYVYHSMSPAVFNPSSPQYKKLFYTLSFLHSVLVERKKFGPLGWITPYYFRDVDFELSKNILTSYLNEYGQSIPWGSVQRLIGDVVYGGIVPNEWDLRVFNAHCKDYLVKECLTDGHELVPGVPQYSVPDKGSLDSHLSHIQALPDDDHPQAFGQDRNADVTAASTDTMTLLQTVLPLILEPNVNQDDDSTVVSLARSILDQLPQQRIKHPYIEHPDHPTLIENIVFRERYTYNHLLSVINNSLTELIIALQGNTCSTSQQVEMCQCLYNGRVPKAWQSAYPSMKPLRFWLIDFLERLSYFQSWAVHGPPVVFWLAAFTSPSEFFVTIKQMVSRAKHIPMDKLDLLFIPMRDTDVTTPHKEGVYLRGLYLEGAGWDRERLCLCEPNPMQMTTELPVFLCRVVCRLECTSNMYTCPVYRLPCRGQVLIEIKLKCGDKTAEHWIKRGTAVLLSTVST